MNTSTQKSAIALVALALLMIVATAVSARFAGSPPLHDMSWGTRDSGGGQSAAGSYSFTASIGQPDASSAGALSGGGYVFTPGFWKNQQPAPARCFGDISPAPNGDGFVDADDLILVILTWGIVNGNGDADGNGIVDVDDLITVILNWGSCQ